MYRVIQVLPHEQKHPLLINLKFSKNSGVIVAVEHSVKISNFLTKQIFRFNSIYGYIILHNFYRESFQTFTKNLVSSKS
jgi:hypothetical protein